jgi:hypothetical protein
MTIADALLILRPGALVLVHGDSYKGIVWTDPRPLPTEAELKAVIDGSKYAEQRAVAYPPIGDQLDALWTGGQAAADMLVKIQAVKAKYPKGA